MHSVLETFLNKQTQVNSLDFAEIHLKLFLYNKKN